MKLLSVWLLLFAGTGFAADLHVDAIHGDDVTGTGSQTAPFRTITAAIAQSAVGDTIFVAPGLYNQALGEVFPLDPPAMATIQGAGAHLTTVSGDGSGTLFRLKDEVCISDLTIRRGDVGVYSFQAHYEIRYLRHCILKHNDVAIHYEDWIHSDSGFVVVNCAIHDNDVAVLHESQWCDFNSVTLLIYGSTIAGNGTFVEQVGSGCERYVGIYKSIIRGNGSDVIGGFSATVGVIGNVLTDPAFVGTDGNVDVDPQWVEPAQGDLHLETTSPIKDAPSPGVSWPPFIQWVGTDLWIWEPTFEEVDELDGDDRSIGAGIEPGSDELNLPSLYITGGTSLGNVLELRSQAAPASALLVFLGLDLYPAPVMGFVWIQPPYVDFGTWIHDADGTSGLALPIPVDTALIGIDVYFQGFQPVSGGYEGTPPRWVRLLP